MYQGRFNDALKIIDDAIIAGKIEQDQFGGADLLFLKADIYEERGELEKALITSEKAIKSYFESNPDDWLYFRHFYIRLLAVNGQFEKARKEADVFRADIEKNDPSIMSSYWYATGCIELAEGSYNESIACLEKAAADETYLGYHYMLGLSYLKSGRLDASVAEFEGTLSRFDPGRAGSPIWAVKIYYHLGQAYEASGWNDKAVEQYETFLQIWQNADPGIEEIDDARARLARLRRES
jgi:tetratricopeptide (TPR) repeat protein